MTGKKEREELKREKTLALKITAFLVMFRNMSGNVFVLKPERTLKGIKFLVHTVHLIFYVYLN